MQPEIHTQPDEQAVFLAAANWIVSIANESIRDRNRFTLVLAGGGTPRGLYRLLASQFADRLDWTRVFFFWGDERSVPATHEESNYRMAKEALLQPLSISDEQIFRVPTELGSPPQVASAYQQTLSEFFSVPTTHNPPAFDLVLLGMGGDGHTLSLFPETDGLHEKEQWIVANEVPKLATERITMTAGLTNAAHHVAFLVVGSGKAQRLAQVIQGDRQPTQLPSQLIEPVSGGLHWFIDQQAGSLLK